MNHWFGSSGIRNSFDKINPEFAVRLGIAAAKVFSSYQNVLIARDARYTSCLLSTSFITGFSSATKSEITNIGLCPTNVLAFSSLFYNTVGIMVTASHNPASDNGFKFFVHGRECNEETEQKIEEKLNILVKDGFFSLNKQSVLNQWNQVGSIKTVNNKHYFREYTNYITKKVKIRRKNLKVVIDCANNVPSLIFPDILKKIGIQQVIAINNNLDPSFSGRPSEPTPENLIKLKETVIKEGADIGIAHDGDGDRCAIIDEKGDFVNPISLICLFLDNIDYSTNRNKVILTTDTTKQARSIVLSRGGSVSISNIGKNREYLPNNELVFLGEPNKVIFPEFGNWIDGLFPALKVMELMESKSLSELLLPYNKRKTLRKAFKITNHGKKIIRTKIIELCRRWSEDIEDIKTTDGIKIFFKDDSSVLIRFSGTEPKIKFYVESDSNQTNQQLLKKIKKELGLVGPGIDC